MGAYAPIAQRQVQTTCNRQIPVRVRVGALTKGELNMNKFERLMMDWVIPILLFLGVFYFFSSLSPR